MMGFRQNQLKQLKRQLEEVEPLPIMLVSLEDRTLLRTLRKVGNRGSFDNFVCDVPVEVPAGAACYFGVHTGLPYGSFGFWPIPLTAFVMHEAGSVASVRALFGGDRTALEGGQR